MTGQKLEFYEPPKQQNSSQVKQDVENFWSLFVYHLKNPNAVSKYNPPNPNPPNPTKSTKPPSSSSSSSSSA
jgi:hypothetical protein